MCFLRFSWHVPSGAGLNAVLYKCNRLRSLTIDNCEGVTSAALLHFLSHNLLLSHMLEYKNHIASGEVSCDTTSAAFTAQSDTTSGKCANKIKFLTFVEFTALTDRGVDALLTSCVCLENLKIENAPLLTVDVLDRIFRRCVHIQLICFHKCANITQMLVKAKMQSLYSSSDAKVFCK